MTLACDDANSKLVEVITVADVADEDRIGKNLLQIWKLRFGHKAKLLFRFSAQGLVRGLKLKLRLNPKLKFDQDLCGACDMNSTLGSVVTLAMFLYFPIDEQNEQVNRRLHSSVCRISVFS